MSPERPPSRSEHLLRSTLERSPAPQQYSSPRAHRRRHSHALGPTVMSTTGSSTCTSAEDDDQLCRAAFLYRTAAVPSHPIHHHHHHPSPSPSRPASPSFRPASPSPSSSRRQSLQRSSASDGNLSFQTLQRHNSIPASKKPSSVAADPLPLTPHEQVLRARLERVLIAGRVVDDKERSRERKRSRDPQREKSPGWVLSSTSPKSSASSGDYYHFQYQPQSQTHHRSRSKTDPITSPPPQTIPTTPRRAATTFSHSTKSPYPPSRHSQRQTTQPPHPPPRNNSNSSSAATPPLTADASPVLGLGDDLMQQQQQQQQHIEPDDMRLLTPPPTPPLVGTTTPAGSVKRPGFPMYRSRTGDSTDFGSIPSPYLYPNKRREVEGSVERLDLSLGGGTGPNMLGTSTFNARKASERCRMMEGYVSFANVEGLGTPPDGVDDEDKDEEKDREDKRGRGLGAWARRLFVGIGHGQLSTMVS